VKILLNSKVLSVARKLCLKGDDLSGSKRRSSGFRVLAESVTPSSTAELAYEFDAVIDCSGTYGNHRWIGAGGIPAVGERKLASASGGQRITYTIPHVLGRDKEKFQRKKTVVVGSGFSAITTINDLLVLTIEESGALAASSGVNKPAEVVWISRHEKDPYVIIPDDPLPDRDRLSQLGNVISHKSSAIKVQFVGGVEAIHEVQLVANNASPDGQSQIQLTCSKANSAEKFVIDHVDNVVGTVGYCPDTSLYRELHVHQCWATEGVYKLAAALIGQSQKSGVTAGAAASSDCLNQTAFGIEVLKNPEPEFFILGSKSYGRNPNFLLKVGFEQIDLVLQAFEAPAK